MHIKYSLTLLICLASRDYTDKTMKDSYVGILLEDIDGKLDALLEGQTLLAPMARRIEDMDDRLINVESSLAAAIAVLTGHSQDLQGHDRRIIKLEHKVFDAGA